jgi:hypothetical protein
MKLPGAGARYPAIALPRPVFAPSAEAIELADDAGRLIGILDSMPKRFFGGSVADYLTAQGTTGERADIIRRGCVGTSTLYGRLDTFAAHGSFRVIEMNLGTALGGLGVAKLNRGLLAQEPFARFARDNKLEFIDPLERLITDMRACAASVVGVDDPAVAVVEDVLGPSAQGRAVVEDLRGLGLNAHASSLDRIGWQAGKIVTDDGFSADLVLRFFMLDDLLAESAGIEKIDMLAAAHRNGTTALFIGLDSDLHSDKGSLGLFYEPRIWAALEPWERELVSRRVPWTRLIGAGAGAAGQGTADDALIDECARRREHLIRKPSVLCRGTGVLFGADVSPRDWLATLQAPDRLDYVVQEVIVPDAEDIIDPDSGESEAWDINWGIYLAGGAYNGSWIRGRRSIEKGIIGMNAGTRPGCAFTYA